MNPLVSVVIPTYNRATIVQRAIESVERQGYRPIEIIVIDDHSSDATPEAVRSIACKLPLVFERLPKNGGPAAARNAGIRKASGQYIAFLDSDDLWAADKIEKQVAAIEGSPRKEMAVVYSQVWIRRPRELLLRPHRGVQPDEPLADYLFAEPGYIGQSTVMLPAALAREVLYDERMRLHEDWDFFLRLHARGAEFSMVGEPLAVYFDNVEHGRASGAQPARSLAVLQQWKPTISRRAFLALRAKIAPQLRSTAPAQAVQFIVEAVLAGAISPTYSLALFGSLVHPRLRGLAYAVRARLAPADPETLRRIPGG